MKWPQKKRELANHSLDSTRWNDFKFRDDDIIIASWAKSGTTWLQQILGQLIFRGKEGLPVFDIAPWIEQRGFPKRQMLNLMERQIHRRFMKTHLPVDALAFSPKAKYIFIGRDGRDALWSWRNHHENMTPIVYSLLNDVPGRAGPPLEPPVPDQRQYFHDWLSKDGFPLWPFWSLVRSWWAIQDLPNVLLVHFNELKRDLPSSIKKVAAFLDIGVDANSWSDVVHHCTFDYMKDHASRLSGLLDVGLRGGARAFIYKGTNDRWQQTLTKEDIDLYDRTATAQLGEACASWLARGEGR